MLLCLIWLFIGNADSESCQNVQGFLRGLSFGRGMGTRIIIDEMNRFKKSEKEQVGVLKRAIGELDRDLKRYAKNYDRAENFKKK